MNRLVCLLLVTSGLLAQTTAKAQIRIKIEVVNSPSEFSDAVLSYLTREVRALSDFTIVNQKPRLTLHIVATSVTLENGATLGYAVSAVLILNDSSSSENTAGLLAGHLVQLTKGPALKDIEDVCKKIITDYDTHVFQEVRKYQ